MALLTSRLNARPIVLSAAVLFAIVPILAGSIVAVRGVADRSLKDQIGVRAARFDIEAAFRYQLDEETGIRGFAATGDAAFLEPFAAAIRKLPATYANVRADVAKLDLSPASRADALAAERTNAEWYRTVAVPLLGRDRTSLALERRGKVLVDRYRANLDRIAVELGDAQTRVDLATAAAVNRILLVGLLLVVAIVALAAFFGVRQTLLVRKLDAAERAAEEQRRIREFQTLGQAMEQMVWTARPDGAIDYYSERWSAYLGVPVATIAERGWEAAVHPEDRSSLNGWRGAIAAQAPITIENRLRRADGTYRWHRHRILPVTDQHGLAAWFATSTDIDEQRREVAALQAAYDAEKRIADTLQEAFLQQALPVVPGLGFSATYVPAAEEAKVGGDWYDIVVLPDGPIFFSIGDVAGHGLEAAVVMSRARQAIIAAAINESDPARTLERANVSLLMQYSRMVTAVCGYIDPQTFDVRYALAGHPPPILLAPKGTPVFLETGGLPLSVLAGVGYSTHHVPVAPGSLLVLYTDGAIEHSRDTLLGEAILIEAVALAASMPQRPAAQNIHETIFSGRAAGDDVAIMTVSFGVPAESPTEPVDPSGESAPIRSILAEP